MKTLPKYFVIKRDGNNPLWDKYIEWINETYKSTFLGDNDDYYGYDGSDYFNGASTEIYIESFKNNPTIITLEEWNECINGEEFTPGEQVAVSDKSVEDAIKGLSTGRLEEYYIGKTKDGEYVTEYELGGIESWKFIAKIPARTERKIEATDEEWDKIQKILKLK